MKTEEKNRKRGGRNLESMGWMNLKAKTVNADAKKETGKKSHGSQKKRKKKKKEGSLSR